MLAGASGAKDLALVLMQLSAVLGRAGGSAYPLSLLRGPASGARYRNGDPALAERACGLDQLVADRLLGRDGVPPALQHPVDDIGDNWKPSGMLRTIMSTAEALNRVSVQASA